MATKLEEYERERWEQRVGDALECLARNLREQPFAQADALPFVCGFHDPSPISPPPIRASVAAWAWEYYPKQAFARLVRDLADQLGADPLWRETVLRFTASRNGLQVRLSVSRLD